MLNWMTADRYVLRSFHSKSGCRMRDDYFLYDFLPKTMVPQSGSRKIFIMVFQVSQFKSR